MWMRAPQRDHQPGQAEAVLLRTEQIPGEHYRFGQRVRAYVDDVSRDARGPQITVSRTIGLLSACLLR